MVGSLQDDEPCPAPLDQLLRPYRMRGFMWMQALDRLHMGGILADDMGLGKTLQVITLLLWAKRRGDQNAASIVVAPTSLVYQLDGGNREIRARTALRRGRGARRPTRADDCAAQRRKPRCGRLSDELSADPPRHRPALKGAVPLRDSRRGAVHQKRNERRRRRGQAAQGADTSGADRHADGEPSGRAVVDLRFRAAGLPQFVRAVHASLRHGRGNRRAAQPHPAVPAAPIEGRRSCASCRRRWRSRSRRI